jgi:signal transduction histidine kinase
MKSLRARLITNLLAGGILLLGVAGFALHWQARRALITEFDAALRVALQSLATLTELEPTGVISIEGGSENLPDFNRPNAGQVFVLSAADGREIARSRSLGGEPLPVRAGSADQPEFFEVQIRNGVAFRCAGIRFLPRLEEENQIVQGPRSEAVLVLGRDRGTVDRSLAALRNALAVTGVTMIALLAGMVGWGVRRGLLPVKQLAESVTKVSATSLSTRFATGSLPSELRPFAERLNDLLARLEESFARERRFSATAAHELRTPLAELRTLAEVNLATPSSETERIESWKDALASTNRMESLALHLLELTRAEDPHRVVQKLPVRVADAIGAAWKLEEAHARTRGVNLKVSISPELAVESDPVLLGVVLGNLCGNAAKYAPTGSTFCIGAERMGRSVAIHFRNPAPALEEKDLPRLFEQFWRKDEARSEGHHHGLGLSVARDHARLIGGSLVACLREGRELEFVLSLPCTQ